MALSLHPGSTLALRKAEFFLSFFSICSSTIFAATLRSAIPGVSFAVSDSFRHVCQLYADDLVVLTASQADLQMPSTLCMHGVFVGAYPLVSAPPNPPLWSSVLCAAALTAVYTSGVPLPLVQQYRYLGVVLSPTLSWRPHVDLLCSRGDRLFHQASAWCVGEGLPLSFSFSVFVTFVL